MTHSIESKNHYIEQLLRLGAELLNLPSTASSVLTVLYYQRCSSAGPLSIKAIGERTGLSVTTVSSLCTILESSGILDRQAQLGSTGRGRKKILFSMRMALHEFLSYCIKRPLKDIDRIHREMKQVKSASRVSDEGLAVFAKAKAEARLFLAEHSVCLRERDYTDTLEQAEQDWGDASANVEGAF